MNSRKHSSLPITLPAALLLALLGTAVADFVATDINIGGTDTGFSGPFYNGSNNVFIEETNDLTSVFYNVSQSGTVARVVASNASPDRQDLRDIATPMTNEVWFSLLVHVTSLGRYAGISFNNYGNSYDPVTTGARILLTTNQLQVGFNGGAASSTGSFASDTNHLILGQMNIVAGNDTLSVWINPNLTAVNGPGDLPPADYTETAVDFAGSITNIGVAGSQVGGGSQAFIDMIMISDTGTAFYDVAGDGAVPPPKGTVLVVR